MRVFFSGKFLVAAIQVIHVLFENNDLNEEEMRRGQ